MKCNACSQDTNINFGDSEISLCEGCSKSIDENQLIQLKSEIGRIREPDDAKAKKSNDIHWLFVLIVIFIAFLIQYNHITGGNLPIGKSDIRLVILAQAEALGAVIFAILIGLIAYFASRKNGKPKRSFLITFVVIFTMSLLGSMGREAKEQKVTAISKSEQEIIDKFKDVQAFITTQESDGFTQDSMDIEVLPKLESWIKNMWVTKTNNYYKENNMSQRISEKDIFSTAVYINPGNTKLAVIKMQLGTVRNTSILGFTGNIFNRVTCMRNSEADIPISYGTCGEKITEAFNVKIP